MGIGREVAISYTISEDVAAPGSFVCLPRCFAWVEKAQLSDLFRLDHHSKYFLVTSCYSG